MPDKKRKPKRSPEEARNDRIFKHYKALKRNYGGTGIEFVPTRNCESCAWSTFPHMHGYDKVITTDADWVLLARTHNLSVREVEDIISERRGWDRNEAIKRRENTVVLGEEGQAMVDRVLREHGIDA